MSDPSPPDGTDSGDSGVDPSPGGAPSPSAGDPPPGWSWSEPGPAEQTDAGTDDAGPDDAGPDNDPDGGHLAGTPDGGPIGDPSRPPAHPTIVPPPHGYRPQGEPPAPPGGGYVPPGGGYVPPGGGFVPPGGGYVPPGASPYGAVPPPPGSGPQVPPPWTPPQSGGGFATPPGYYGAAGGVAPQQEGLAIASLVVGIASIVLTFACCFGIIAGPVALGLGITARRNIDQSQGMKQGGGMAMAGMICGGIGLALSVLVLIAVVAG